MNSKGLLLAFVALAVVGLGVFLATGGLDMFGSTATDDAGDGDTDFVDVDAMDDETADDTTTKNANPVLFGRASARIGQGDAIGKLVDFASKDAVAGATLKITGIGFADENVSVTCDSAKDGRFHLTEVAAGESYKVEVLQDGAVVRAVRGVTIQADKVEDLGTIFLGDAGTLEGKVMQLDGTSIAGAEVAVLPGGISQEEMMQDIVGFISKLDRDPEPLGVGKTDANGRFRIEGLAPGPITVVARADGYHQELKSAVMSKDGAVGKNPEFFLESATAFTGRVINEEGMGVGGARIAFMDSQNDETGFYGRRFVETESDGTFAVKSPPNAGKLITIIAAESYPTLFSEVEGETEDLEFVLVGGARLLLTFLNDETGEPIPDASIVAMVMEGENMQNDRGTFLTGVTDPLGQVDFIARPGHVFMLFFEHPKEGISMYSPRFGMAGAGFALKGPDQMKLEKGDNEAELRKPAGVFVTGTVTDPDGRPVAGATVKFVGGFFSGGGSGGITDENGQYQMMAPKMPQILVSVSASGHVQGPETMQVEVGDARQVEHDVKLLWAATVEGKIVGPKGEPAAGLEVRLNAVQEGDEPIFSPSDMMGNTKTSSTDTAGRFVIEDVVPGLTYRVLARGPGYITTQSDAFEVGGTVRHAKAPRLTMKKGVNVDVVVLGPSGDDVNGARVDVHIEPKETTYWSQMSRWRAFDKLVTNPAGRATAKDVPDGKITFTARAKGFAASRASTDVSAAGGETATVEVRLRPSVEVSGVIRDQHGDLVQGARVSVNEMTSVAMPGEAVAQDDSQWVPSASSTTNSMGRFDIEGVPADVPLTLWVHADGYKGKNFPVEGRSDSLELEIIKVDPNIQKRIDALQAELMQVYTKMQSAKDDAERQELGKQIQELSAEMARLRQEGGAVDAPVAVPADR